MLLAGLIGFGFLGLALIAIAIMMIALYRGGDERRHLIVTNAAAATFKMIALVDIILIVLYAAQGHNVLSAADSSYFAQLTMMAIFFTYFLWHYQRKFS
ncbi:hypothetical protein ACFQ3L_07245 [Lacticaseibacillus jixianensis]|uniref:Uncharacterized protein n=1 Tax=Lacticaseibacillus jixianensis TaxID=2486012 RepID=A0ABW4BCW3_9LACO|nr:hypothetical protein [Lacticaseibacillus jixianensis]